MGVFNPAASRATNLAALKAAINALVLTNQDGAKELPQQSIVALFNNELTDAVAGNANFLTDADRNRYLAGTAGQSKFAELAKSTAAVINRTNWEHRPDWPLGATADSKEDRVAKVDAYQQETWTLARGIIERFEQRKNNLRERIRDWLEANVLNLDELDEDGNVIPGSFPEAEKPREDSTRAYILTYVTDRLEESKPSPASNLIEFDERDVSGGTLPAPPSGWNIVGVRLYRSSTTDQSAAWQLITIPQGDARASRFPTAVYDAQGVFLYFGLNRASFDTDNIKQEELQEACITHNWDQPPDNLKGIVALPNGITAGIVPPNEIAFCEDFVGHAWPKRYRISLEYEAVALAPLGQAVFVATAGNPYILAGASASTMSAVKLSFPQACVSARALVAAEGGVIYPSPDGLMLVTESSASNLTEAAYTRDDWQALPLSESFAAYHDGTYFLFFPSYALTFALEKRQISTVPVSATAVHVDVETDTMYLAIGGSIHAAFGSASFRTGTWRSGKIVLPAHSPLGAAVIESEFTAPVTLRIYDEAGSLWHTATVNSRDPIRLPSGRHREITIELSSTARVTKLVVATSIDEIRQL